MNLKDISRTALAVLFAAAVVASPSAGVRAGGQDRPKVDVGDYAFAQKDALKGALDKEIEYADDKLEKITDANPPETRNADGQRLIVDVQAKRAAAKEAVDALDEAKGPEAWDQAREQAGDAVGELRDSLDAACDELLPEKK